MQTRLTEAMLRDAARRTLAESPICKAVVLFGSRARGDARPDSDWDVAVVTEGPDPGGVVPRIREKAFECLPGEVNAVGMTEATLRAWRNAAGHIAVGVARDGITLAGKLEDLGDLEMKPEMNPKQFHECANSVLWMIKALNDVASRPSSELDKERFCAILSRASADASELFAKMAFNRRTGFPPPRTHAVDRIADELRERHPRDESLIALARMIDALNGRTRKHHEIGYPEIRQTPRDVRVGRLRLGRLLPALQDEILDAMQDPGLSAAAAEAMKRFLSICLEGVDFLPRKARPLTEEALAGGARQEIWEPDARVVRAAVRSFPSVRRAFAGCLEVGRGRPPFTQLHAAARDGNMAALAGLLAEGADPSAISEADLTPLHLAASRGNPDAAKSLLAASANPDARDARQATPLHDAASSLDPGTTEVLLEAGADPNATDVHGWTPLHEAALQGGEAIMALLLEAGADANARDVEQMTPLHVASESESGSAVELLFLHGSEVKVQDLALSTPLHRAAESGCVASVEALLKRGADVGPGDVEGWTPLHEAAASRDRETVATLLAAGASAKATTRAGLTPCDVARDHGGSSAAAIMEMLSAAEGSEI